MQNINKIGANINQIAHRANETHMVTPQDMTLLKEYYRELHEEIRKIKTIVLSARPYHATSWELYLAQVKEAKERKDDLEYVLGYKTHVLYAAALLCQQELNGYSSADGKPSFDVVMQQYIPKVFDVKKKTASFLFFAHLGNRRSVDDLMRMLQTITEETEYVLAHVDEFEDLMNFPRENYHPLRDDEWQLIRYIVEHNLEVYNTRSDQYKEMVRNVFGTNFD
jgi:hypothetical protein